MRRIFLTMVSVCALVRLAAQEEKQILSFDEALSIAMTNNPTILASEYDERAAHRSRQAAVGLRAPKISVGGAYSYMGKDIALDLNGTKNDINNFIGGALRQGVASGLLDAAVVPTIEGLLAPLAAADLRYVIQNRSFGFVGGEVTMPIFMGGKINVANRAAKLNEQSVSMQTAQSRNAVTSELVERYFGLSLAMHVANVRRQARDGVKKHLDDAMAMEANGMIARSERLYVEFKYSEAERDLQNALMQITLLRHALNSTLGVDNDLAPATAMFVMESIDGVDYFKRMAAENSPLLREVSIKARLAKENVKLRRADFYPQIVAMGGASFYDYQVTEFLPRWAVGVGVSFRIFDGLSTEYNYSAARNTAKRVEMLETKAEKDIAVLIQNLYDNLTTYANQITSIESSLAFAEEYLETQNAAFLAGMGSSSDLINAQLNLAKVQAERLQAAYNYDVALAKLLEAAGVSERFADYARSASARQITMYNGVEQ